MLRRISSFLLCYILFGSMAVYGTTAIPDTSQVAYDSSRIEWSSFNQNKLESYRRDSDFSYHQKLTRTEGVSLWSQFWNWLFSKISSTLGKVDGVVYKIIMYLFTAGVILYIILRMIGVDVRSFLYRRSSSASGLPYQVSEENIHEMDFDHMIDQAIQKQEYRKAVRLFYLASLKKLTDRDIIEWRPGKTNHEYANELQATKVNHAFENLSYYFEYIWYGNFPVDKRIFGEAQKSFRQLIDQIHSL